MRVAPIKRNVADKGKYRCVNDFNRFIRNRQKSERSGAGVPVYHSRSFHEEGNHAKNTINADQQRGSAQCW